MRLLIAILALALLASPAVAQVPELGKLIPAGDPSVSGRILQYVVLLTVLSLAPGLLIMVTSFTRLVIAFSFLRSGLGLQSTPANLVMVSLALFLTFFVMAPVFDKAKTEGLDPYMAGQIGETEAYQRITGPFRDFMTKNVRDKDLALFEAMARQRNIAISPDGEIDLRILVPAFMISELRRGFEIGFLIALPFLVIDLIVSMLTMSMGMMMLPPTVISLPFKVLFFVLIDGWHLLAGSLVNSFITS
ncbi:flagellar type III secretion system pore protein FliP [Aestuariivirga sp.]|uniref:flagellar type III secretion system pore protein FliP n=1 Tax=Aestuariivirga sp. TaxID=2650926 RepID=UPI0025C6EC49|nr:flagellar type III secretion system pore protein FliP [Aestuariivirga sp.]MCA3554242.1 flagellar type III secretion system pore protein FliP [Aestuariivirga sp.]